MQLKDLLKVILIQAINGNVLFVTVLNDSDKNIGYRGKNINDLSPYLYCEVTDIHTYMDTLVVEIDNT